MDKREFRINKLKTKEDLAILHNIIESSKPKLKEKPKTEAIKEKTINQTIEQKIEEPERKETYEIPKEQLIIPQISIKLFSVKPPTELDTTVNIVKTVKTEEKSLKIPQLNLAKFTLSKITNLDTSILIERKADEKLLIPQLRLERFKPITAISNLDTELSITVEKQSSLKIPKLVLTKFRPIKPYERFLTDKPVQIQQPMVDYSKTKGISDQSEEYREVSVQIQESKITPEERIKEIVESTAESSSESEGYELLEEIDFIEFLLGKGSGKILSGKPLCIIVERHPDKYEYVVATICREVYREKKGGYPHPIPVKTVDEIEFEFKADVSDQIIIVENAKYSESLRKAILKFPFSSLGFLILVTDKPEELEMEIRKNIPKAEEYILRVEPVKIDEKLKISVVEFISGSQLLKSYSFGEDFIKATQMFNDQLEKYLDFSKAPNELKVMWHKLMAKSPESSEHASFEHSAMKSFVWQYLWKIYKKVPRLEDERGVDVSIDNENYEIETFYGCGDPIAKLTEKMEKFTQNDKIFFVLRNISILMHLKELISFKKTWKDLGYNIEILGIDFKRNDLIPIDEIITLLKNKNKSSRTSQHI